jgi:tricorn protease
MRHRIFSAACLLLCQATFAVASETGGTRLLRFPDICADTITFVYAGDIYTVAAQGGNAARLTSHEGLELYPKFSPDCRWIAFSGEYDGTRQVYAIPAAGGAPRQLTFYNDVGPLPPRGGTDYRVLDWTPDGKQVLVRANRTPYDERSGRPYLVPLDGGLETPLAITESGGGMFSPDGKSLVYTPIDRDFRSWKRYRGGRAPDVWTYDLVHNASKRLTDDSASDAQPMWVGEQIYFASDRNGKVNLFSIAPAGGAAKQITQFTDFDVLWPSAGKDAIVFENGGYIHRFDPRDGRSTQVSIQVQGDLPYRLPAYKKVAAQVESFDISPHGERAVFAARGEILTVPAKHGEIRNLSRTPTAREIAVSWSPDGKQIAYLSDATGEYELYVRNQDGKDQARRVTRDGDVWRFQPVWSSDSKKLLYADKKQRLRFVDIATGALTEIDHGGDNDITEYAWSPDSEWVAYTRTNSGGLTQVWLYSAKSQQRVAATEATSSAFSPAFDPKGRYLYFLSNRDFNLTFSAYEQNYLYTQATRVYALTLDSAGAAIYPPPSDESGRVEAPDSKDKDKNKERAKEKPAAPKVSRVDTEGLQSRLTALKVSAGNYQALGANEDGVLFLSIASVPNVRPELRQYLLADDSDHSVLRGVGSYRLSDDGRKILVQQGDKYAIVEAKADQDAGKGTLELERFELRIDPAQEWNQEFVDAWRILRDWFYDPGMHGGIERWNAIRARYQALVPYIAHRADLDYILGEIAGEANSGHVYVQTGDQPKVERHAGGLLGAEIESHASGYFRVAKVFAGENWDNRLRSPLTEAGIDVKAGNFLLAVDNVDARSTKNFYQLLQGKGDQIVSLRVNSRPDEVGAREVRLKTLTTEQPLRYRDWVAARRAMVEKLGGGRIGYIHVPNTAVDGNRELFKGLIAYAHKDALIIDDRYNGGGFIPDRMAELLARQPLNYWKRRGLDPQATPLLSHQGPKAMLINGLSSSGGDAFPYYFRKLNLGPLIGTRTWGGLIGISGNPGLADGGSIQAATFRFLATDGKWAVENEGVSPDIEVVDRPEEFAVGKDPSVEKAVEILLQELRKNPPVRIEAPPAPANFEPRQGQ